MSCEFCNKDISIKRKRVTNKHNFCSPKCYWSWKKGRNESCWQKGKTKETDKRIAEIVEKSKNTLIERYGSNSTLSAPNAKNKMVESRRKTDNYGKGIKSTRFYRPYTDEEKEHFRQKSIEMWKNPNFREKIIKSRTKSSEVVDICIVCNNPILSERKKRVQFCSVECRKKNIKKLRNYTPEERRKKYGHTKGKTFEELYGKERAKKIKHSMSKKRERTKESIEETRKKLKLAWERNPERKIQQSKRMKENNIGRNKVYSNTKIEKIVQEELTKLKVKYVISKTDIFGWPDIFIEPNICIFVDGCYWHCCHIHCPRTDEQAVKRVKRDLTVTKYLQDKGYKVLRFWEHDIHENLSECIKIIMNSIRECF